MFLITGCSHKSNATIHQVKIDGTKTDYSKFNQFKKVEKCYGSDGGDVVSIVELSKSVGITKIRHIDDSIETTWMPIFGTSVKMCKTIYGE